MGETSWAFLIVGSFAAVGAALALGTLAALVRYHRTGSFPGTDETAEVSAGRYVGMWVRVAIGAVLAMLGVVALVRAGLL